MRKPFYSADKFEPDRSVGYLIKRAAKHSGTLIEACFAGEELTSSHWIALAMIRHGQADNAAGLARQMGHDSGAVTRLVDQLETRGLLDRKRCPNDRRVVVLALTEAGERQFAAMTPLLLGAWNALLAGFEHREIETLIALLTRLVAALEAREATQALLPA